MSPWYEREAEPLSHSVSSSAWREEGRGGGEGRGGVEGRWEVEGERGEVEGERGAAGEPRESLRRAPLAPPSSRSGAARAALARGRGPPPLERAAARAAARRARG